MAINPNAATTTVRADRVKKGDRFVSSDGRGIEKVTSNRPYTKGMRSIRTTRCDHHWPADRKVEVLSAEPPTCTCPDDARGPHDCCECPEHGEQAQEELAAEHKSELDAENAWLRAAEAGYPGYDDDRERELEANDPQLNGSWRT